ncbi:MAG: ComF family protein [Candidatus Omnitrophota bacterium]
MLKGILKSLLNVTFPSTCLACRTPLDNTSIDSLLCYNCWKAIKRNTPPLCAICGRKIRGAYQKVCPNCQRQNFSFDRAFSPCAYEGVIRELIHKFKYQNKDYLKLLLSRLLIEFIQQYRLTLDFFDLVIPIPLHGVRLKEREFNQAEILARKIADNFSLPLSPSNLWRKHHRQAQIELDTNQRWKNIKGCFTLRDPAEVRGKKILLIDDVLTTGATCSEAASVLKTAGAINIWVLTLAN